MLFGFLSFLFFLSLIIMVLLILVQKGKDSLGLGSLGGGNQMLFGSGGGQDFFQKSTWVLGAILIFGSLGLAIWKTKQMGVGTSLLQQRSMPSQPGSNIPTDIPIDG